MQLTEWPADAKRVMVYGVTGSGKTTLAQRLSGVTGLPWWAVDELTWDPGWTPVPDDEQRRRIGAICAGDTWILDHGYGKWLDLVARRCDLIVGLDYPRLTSLSRLVLRSAKGIALHTPTCNGNVETIRTVLSDESIVRWHFASFARKRERIRHWEADPASPPVLRLDSPRAADRLLHAIRYGAALAPSSDVGTMK